MTERGRADVHRTASSLTVGPSALWWDGNGLTIRIDEMSSPLPSRVRGVVRVYPAAVIQFTRKLDPEGCHHWWPIAPRARIEVAFDRPNLDWSGPGYMDSNFGSEPLEDCFARWDWSRICLDDRTAVIYDITRRDGSDQSIAVEFDATGNSLDFAKPSIVSLPPTLWRVRRQTRTENASAVAVIKTLEDAPFYTRSTVATHLRGKPATAMHESLSLDRFRQPWVRMLLPFRMPRIRSRQSGPAGTKL